MVRLAEFGVPSVSQRHVGNMPPADIGARSVTPGRR